MLNSIDIIQYLNEINEKLAERNIDGEIVLTGGALMCLQYQARPSTQDIDAYFSPSSEIRSIIQEMANEHDLPDDWMNDGAKGFITNNMHTDVLHKYSNLTVYALDTESLLAMKLSSARLDSKDMDDAVALIKKLDIKTSDELLNLVEQYIPKERLTPNIVYFTEEAFERSLESL